MGLEIIGGPTTVAVAPVPPDSGTTLTITANESAALGSVNSGGYFHAAICPSAQTPIFAGPRRNAEIVLVTADSSNDYTILRSQAGTTARSVVVGDVIYPVVIQQQALEPVDTAGVAAGMTWAYNLGSATQQADLGALYPGDDVKVGMGVAYKVPSTTAAEQAFAFAAEVEALKASVGAVAVHGVGKANVSTGTVWGANFIVYNTTGKANTVLHGVEIDVQPVVAVDTDSDGLRIVAYNIDGVGSAVHILGAFSGTFNNGLHINGGIKSNGSGVLIEAVTSAYGIFINTNNTFSAYAAYIGGNVNVITKANVDANINIDTTTAGKNSNITLAAAGTTKWVVYRDGANSDRMGFFDGTNDQVRLTRGAPGANNTILSIAEGATPTLRLVKWMDPGAGGGSFVGGEKVLYLA